MYQNVDDRVNSQELTPADADQLRAIIAARTGFIQDNFEPAVQNGWRSSGCYEEGWYDSGCSF